MKYSAGHVLGRYELLVPIARGGMAQVWAARLRGTRGFQKIFAIKMIRADANDPDRMEQMFLEEATIASQIHHPNVVATMELGEHEGTLYIVMEWVEGEPLAQVMKHAAERGGVPIPVAVNLIAQACKGLQAAHELRDESGMPLGVVHRDVSPQNVLVTYSGTAKLVDFGVAKVTGRNAAGLTRAGELKGKLSYMAPEQVSGSGIDRRTDIFAMGILLYYLTTGRHPFQGANTTQTLENITSSKTATAPSSFVEGYPLELERVVLTALCKNPDERWATANDMLTALESAVPQCHEGSFEGRVAAFMKELFGERSRERRSQLRLAQEFADRALPESQRASGSTSVGSLRAVAFDGGVASTGGTLPSTRVPIDEVSFVPSLASQRVPPRRFVRWLVAGVAACGAFALLTVAGRVNWTEVQRRGAASLSISEAIEPGAPAPAPLLAPTPPVAPSAAPGPRGEVEEGGADASARTAPDRPARAAAPVKPAPHPASPAPAFDPAPAPAEKAAVQDGSSANVWDRQF